MIKKSSPKLSSSPSPEIKLPSANSSHSSHAKLAPSHSPSAPTTSASSPISSPPSSPSISTVPDSSSIPKSDEKRQKRSRVTPGGRNLIILGVASTLIALATTTIGLAIYHLSGDIYLDRSRPGYLPDETEVEEEAKTEPEAFTFDKTGPLDHATVDEYLERLTDELNAIDKYEKPFDESALSDDNLGIPQE